MFPPCNSFIMAGKMTTPQLFCFVVRIFRGSFQSLYEISRTILQRK